MKRIVFTEPGGPEMLVVETVPIPKPKPTQIIVKNQAIGVNYIDVLYRSGTYAANGRSGIGEEGAGVVLNVGQRVEGFQVGDPIAYAFAERRAYADYVALDEACVFHRPPKISPALAASVLFKAMTGFYLTHKTWKIHKNATVFVNGASGGVGRAIVRFSKRLGATVLGQVGRPRKIEFALAAGCDHVLCGSEADVIKRVRDYTNGRGVDAVYDAVGEAAKGVALGVLAERAIWVQYGAVSGSISNFELMLLAKHGSLYVTRPTSNTYLASRTQREEAASAVWEAIESGLFDDLIWLTLPLEDASKAHSILEKRTAPGPLVLQP